MFFFNEIFYKMKKGKITRKNTPTKIEIAKQECSVLYLSFFSFLFPFFLPFFFLTQCCWSFSCWTSYSHLLHVPGAGRGGGGSFRVQSLMMTLWIYIYRRPWRSRKQAQPLQALLSTCDRWDRYRDCGQAGKEKLFFYFFGLWPYFEWGASRRGGEGGMLTRIHTHTHIHIRQQVSCEDWSLTALSAVCMYVYVYERVCGTMQNW